MKSEFIIEEYYGNLSRLYTNLRVWNTLGCSCSSQDSHKIVIDNKLLPYAIEKKILNILIII